MPIRIEERFAVRAPVERIWEYLVDPRRVVRCLPGAELTAVVDERNFKGMVKVKVGPVTVAYRGSARLDEVDASARRVRMSGEGRESAGAGSAKMTMESSLAPARDGGTEILVRADVDVAGRIVQLGRGMIEQVAHQLFAQFAECVRTTLEADSPAAAAPGTTSAVPATTSGARPVRALPLVFRALVASIAAWFRRVFRRER